MAGSIDGSSGESAWLSRGMLCSDRRTVINQYLTCGPAEDPTVRKVYVASSSTECSQAFIWHVQEQAVFLDVFRSPPAQGVWAAERIRAGPDDGLDAASMMKQTSLHALVAFIRHARLLPRSMWRRELSG